MLLNGHIDGSSNDNGGIFYGPSSDVRLITIALLAMISVSGAVGNALVFLSVWFEPKLKIVSSIFIVNISVVGFLFSTLSIPFHIYHLTNRFHFLKTEGVTCIIFGYLNFLFLLATLASSCAIAINRYIVVTKPKLTYLKQYTYNRIIIWIVVLWVVPAALAACGIPYYGYHENVMACSLLSSPDAYWFTCVLIGGPAAGTFMVILFLYCSIFKTVRCSRRRIMGFASQQMRNVHVSNVNKSSSENDNTDIHSGQGRGRWAEPRKSQNKKSRVSVHTTDSTIELTHERDQNVKTADQYVTDPTHKVHAATTKSDSISKDRAQYKEESSRLPSACEKRKGAVKRCNSESQTILNASNRNIKIINRQAKVPMELFYADGKSSVATEFPLHDDTISHIRANRPPIYQNERSIQIKTDSSSETIQITDTRRSKSTDGRRSSDKPIVIINTKSSLIEYEIKLTFHLFIVFAVYCVLFLPMSFTYLVDRWKPVDPDAWMAVQIMSSSYFALAWILYGLFNRKFRKAYIKILKCERLRERFAATLG